MPNLHALLRSNGFKFVFGIVYHLQNLMRLKRLKIKTHHFHKRWEQNIKSKTNPFAGKVRKNFAKNRRKLWIFNFFDYLCEKVKN